MCVVRFWLNFDFYLVTHAHTPRRTTFSSNQIRRDNMIRAASTCLYVRRFQEWEGENNQTIVCMQSFAWRAYIVREMCESPPSFHSLWCNICMEFVSAFLARQKIVNRKSWDSSILYGSKTNAIKDEEGKGKNSLMFDHKQLNPSAPPPYSPRKVKNNFKQPRNYCTYRYTVLQYRYGY